LLFTICSGGDGSNYYDGPIPPSIGNPNVGSGGSSLPPNPCQPTGNNDTYSSESVRKQAAEMVTLGTPCGGGNTGWTPITVGAYTVFFDAAPTDQKVDINKLMKCFDYIPNNGATYSVKLSVDIPKDSDPTQLSNSFNLTGKAGHVFLTLTKTNGNQSVSQSFGFYPTNSVTSLTLKPVSSSMVNDGVRGREHVYNASLTMQNISASNFQTLINTAINKSSNDYVLNSNNCAHYALGVLNSIRNNKIGSVPMFGTVPGTMPPTPILFNESPAGLYQSLAYMKNSNSSDAPNIEIGVLQYARTGNGECN